MFPDCIIKQVLAYMRYLAQKWVGEYFGKWQ